VLSLGNGSRSDDVDGEAITLGGFTGPQLVAAASGLAAAAAAAAKDLRPAAADLAAAAHLGVENGEIILIFSLSFTSKFIIPAVLDVHRKRNFQLRWSKPPPPPPLPHAFLSPPVLKTRHIFNLRPHARFEPTHIYSI